MIKLIGIAILIIGFALKFNSIAIIFVSMIATAIVGGLGIEGFLETLGTSFVNNRAMMIFVIVMLVTGTLERNGLRESAAKFISRIKNASAGKIIASYGIMRVIFAAFNAGFGGVAGFIRPVVMPMAEAAVREVPADNHEEHIEEVKGMAAGMENITWFFGQVLFVGGSGGLLVQGTLKELGYNVELIDLAKVEIPVALIATIVGIIYYILKDKKLSKNGAKGEIK
ncbi:putative membrane protein [Peptoniphilus koenoeneniae]|uniref:Membrane protein n=1 Tax=Peptoniphilus koenoeneniae TaxID=507751 RepID=A0ABU0AUK2_9FIRM|nr:MULTISPECIES: DUF969 family protein [Peptoniphilus]ERT59031.1 PF06149 family protein [Peptoniphilus sp. BV3C26]MDQ0274534.1 putative membrane protein [Peptoniphilus koenoeneniae]